MSSLTLKALLKERSDTLYHDPVFMTFVEDHVPNLRASSSTRIVDIEPAQALKYQGDMYGLFTEYQIPQTLHYATLKINGFNSPIQVVPGIISRLMVPDPNEFRKLFLLWKSHNATRK